jgi:hypothetical protein
LFTGREPFGGDNPIAVLYQVVHHDPPAPAAVNPALAGAISDVIVRGLSKESADRFADVLEFAAALRAAVDATTPVETVTTTVETVTSEATMDAGSLAVDAPGRETRRLIRRIRRKNAAPRRLIALTLAVGLGALAWFHPATRGPTRAAWGQLSGEAQKMIDRFRPAKSQGLP